MSGEVDDLHGPSPVARGRTYLPGRVRAAGAAGCCGLVLAGAIWVVWPQRGRDPDGTATASAAWSMGQSLPERPLRAMPPPPEPVVVAANPPLQAAPVLSPVVAPARLPLMGFWEDQAVVQQIAQQNASRTASPPGRTTTRSDPDVAAPGPASEYAQRMQTTRFADTAPEPHKFHVSYTIKKGTIFPCTPAQPISSTLPGPVRCTVDQDVWSMDGTTILLPRGTQVNGTVERGLTTGEERLFLVWTDALTPRPDLLAIPLDSPASDELGQTGVPGDVDDHLWKRIKAALLLSAVDLVSNGATAALQQGSNNTYLNLGGLGGTSRSLGQMAFGRDINIPPTLYRGPGQPLTVYVNHYIDLYRFYQNRVRQTP